MSRGTSHLPAKVDTALFARRLRLALADKGWKAAELARQLGVSRQLAASWARGRALPSGSTAARLPVMLGVSGDWLFPTGARRGAAAPRAPAGERSGGSAGLVQGGTDAQYGRRAGNTPDIPPGGEEILGSPALDVLREEAAMAATVLQRAIRKALERDEYVRTREGRDLVIEELVQFSQRLGLIGLGDIGLEISTLAHRMRRAEDASP